MAIIATHNDAHRKPESQEITVHGPETPAEYTDRAALAIVVSDARRDEMFLDSQQWKLQWRETDILYQSPRTLVAWENSGITRSNVSRFTVAKHVNSLVPMVMSGIFYDSPPFVYRPRPNTTQATVRAKVALHAALLADKTLAFKTECERGIESQCLNGTGVWKWGHYTETKLEKRFVAKAAPLRVKLPFGSEQEIDTAESDEHDIREEAVTRWKPFFEHVPLGQVLVEGGWRHSNQIWRAKHVIHRQYLTFRDLDKLRQRSGYLVPATEILKSYFFGGPETPQSPANVETMQSASQGMVHHAEGREQITSEDPLERPLKVDEYWTDERVIVVVQDKLIIRNELHDLGCIPFLSANWWNIQNAGYGMGIGRLTGQDQRVEQGAMNAALDILGLSVNQQYVRSRGGNVQTQQIRSRLGGIIDVDGDVDKAFKILDPPRVPPELWTAIQTAKNAGEAAAGSDEAFVQGNMPGRGSSVGRTATGAGNIAAASATRIQGPVGRFVDNVFIPFLVHLDEMVNQYMPTQQVREILGNELGQAYKADLQPDGSKFSMTNFLNAEFTVEVLAGAHLAAKKAMAQSLPLIIQIFENPHLLQSLNQTGWTVDVKELFDMLMEMSEWKNTRSVIRPLNKNEMQMMMSMQTGVQRVAGDIKKIEAKHQANAQEIDQKREGQLGHDIAMHALESMDNATAIEMRQHAQGALEARLKPEPEKPAYNTTG